MVSHWSEQCSVADVHYTSLCITPALPSEQRRLSHTQSSAGFERSWKVVWPFAGVCGRSIARQRKGRALALLCKTARDGARLLAAAGGLGLRHSAKLCIQFCTALQILLFEGTCVMFWRSFLPWCREAQHPKARGIKFCSPLLGFSPNERSDSFGAV